MGDHIVDQVGFEGHELRGEVYFLLHGAEAPLPAHLFYFYGGGGESVFLGHELGPGDEEFRCGAVKPGLVEIGGGFLRAGGTFDRQLRSVFVEVYLVFPEEEVIVVVNFYLFAEEFVWGVFFPHDEV